jgi:hypothetical protein
MEFNRETPFPRASSSVKRHLNVIARPMALVITGVFLLQACLTADASAATAKRQPELSEVLKLAAQGQRSMRFLAERVQRVVRQDMVLDARARIHYQDSRNYQITLQSPNTIKGLHLNIDNDALSAFFPSETLLFQNDIAAGAEEVKDLVMGRILSNPEGLSRHYRLTLAPETDIVALYPCFKLTVEPVGGLGANTPPGYRLWIAQETGLIMKEERYWTPDGDAYFISHYESLSLRGRPLAKQNYPKEVSRLKLKARTPTSLLRFGSVAAAQQAGYQVAVPSLVPVGFELRAIDVMSLYGTDIVLLRYDDGLSNLVVTYRPKPNIFLTLVAGAFALNLVDKISALSYHAPNNYAVVEKGNDLIYTYGDLWQERLTEIAQSVSIPEGTSRVSKGS